MKKGDSVIVIDIGYYNIDDKGSNNDDVPFKATVEVVYEDGRVVVTSDESFKKYELYTRHIKEYVWDIQKDNNKMTEAKTVICGNPDCETELRPASINDYVGFLHNRLHQEHCKKCGYTTIPKVK